MIRPRRLFRPILPRPRCITQPTHAPAGQPLTIEPPAKMAWLLVRANMTSMDASYPCCEEVLRWNLVFRVGVRQAPDEQQEPTLPTFASFASGDLPDLSEQDAEWFRSDKMRPRSGCPPYSPSKASQDKLKLPRHELCVRPDRHVNHDPWQRFGTDHTRTAKATALLASGTRKSQTLAPYRAPLWRLKPGLGFGVRSEAPEKRGKGKADETGKGKGKGKSAKKRRGVELRDGPKIDVVSSTFGGLGLCSSVSMAACEQLVSQQAEGPIVSSGKNRSRSSTSCPIMGKPCRRCHFWFIDENSRACLPPNSTLPSVLTGKVRSHIRGEKKLRKNGPGEAVV